MKVYFIPLNYEQPGHVFNGMIPLRNFIDALVLVIIGYFIASIFAPADFWEAISWYILICGLLGLLGIIGIQGIPLSIYLLDFIKWTRRRAPYFFNHHGSAYSCSAADVMLHAPQFRDYVADLLESFTDKFKPQKAAYIEGETFEFAEDPELAYLQNAEEKAKQETDLSDTPIDKHPAENSGTPSTSTNLDFDGILDNITLAESEEQN